MKLPSGAGPDYWIGLALATSVVERYVVPLPGTALFVLPGAARPVAAVLVASLPLRRVSQYRRKVLVDHLSTYLARAERPLRSESGKPVEMQLVTLGMANTEAVGKEVFKASSEIELLRIPETMEEVRGWERRRSEAQKAPRKSGATKKRDVTLRRNIKDLNMS